MPALGYGADWRNFADAIARARVACQNSGHDPADHFGDATKKVAIGSGAERTITDFALTRYAAYLLAMNGDSRKGEIANAQTYFAVRTREAEARTELDELEVARRYLAALEQKRALEGRVAELEPKAEAFDTFQSADGTYSFEQVAKMLLAETGLGRNKLMARLRELHVLTQHNTPYQDYAHHFHVLAQTFEGSDGRRNVTYTTRVQATGVDFIRRKCRKDGWTYPRDLGHDLPEVPHEGYTFGRYAESQSH
jgi:DNA-damage-inducible protein D